MRSFGIAMVLLLGGSACDGPRRALHVTPIRPAPRRLAPRPGPGVAEPPPRRQAESQLDRRDAPPPGIPRIYQPQFMGGFGKGGGPICPRAGMRCINGRCQTLGSLRVYPHRSVLVAGLSLVTVCVTGVAVGQKVTVEITSPSGQRTTVARASREDSFREEMVLPPGPAGAYRVTARTGGRTHRAPLTARAARRRSLTTAPNGPVAGARVTLAIAGFPPRQSVALHVYWLENDTRYRYRTTVTLRTDAHGIAQRRLRTQTRDRPGNYYVGPSPGNWMGYIGLEPYHKKPD